MVLKINAQQLFKETNKIEEASKIFKNDSVLKSLLLLLLTNPFISLNSVENIVLQKQLVKLD